LSQVGSSEVLLWPREGRSRVKKRPRQMADWQRGG
jgi:hypothetical protein